MPIQKLNPMAGMSQGNPPYRAGIQPMPKKPVDMENQARQLMLGPTPPGMDVNMPTDLSGMNPIPQDDGLRKAWQPGVYQDEPGSKPQFPTFLSHVIPADVTPPSDQRAVVPGEHGTDSTASYDEISGMNSVADDLKIIEARRAQHASTAVAAQNMPVSRGRKIASVLGGIGMGLATMNPMAGVGMGKMIYGGERDRVASQMAGNAVNDETAFKNTAAIGGMYGTAGERRAQLGQANAANTKANADAAQGNYERENPKMNTTVQGNGQQQITPERAKSPADAAAQTVPVGKEKPAGVHSSTVKVQADGTPVVIMTNDDGTVSNVPVTGVKVSPENESSFSQGVAAFKEANPSASKQDLVQFMLHWQSVSAIQSGSNQASDDDRKREHDASVAFVAGEVEDAFRAWAKQDPTLLTDPVKAAKKYQEIILNIPNTDPNYAPFVGDVLMLPKYKTPTVPKAGPFDKALESMQTPPKGPGQ